MRHLLLSLFVCCIPLSLTAQDTPKQKPPTASVTDAADVEAFFDGAIRTIMEQKHIAGGVVTVVADGKIVLCKGYGYADVAARQPVDPDKTLFSIASISKPFTWTAVMQQVEAGKINLQEDISKYVKDVRIPATYDKPITMQHLLTHTPGFEDHVLGLFRKEPDSRSLREVLQGELPARVRLPGTLASYSNHGTALAAYAVECVAEMPWENYIEQKIFQPLGMTQSLVRQPVKDKLPAGMSKGYEWKGGQFVDKGFEYIPAGPAGCVRSTGKDMAQFMLAHLNDGQLGTARILSTESAQKMRQPLFQHDKRVSAMCFGFFEEQHHGLRLVGHGGDTIYFHSLLQLIPDKKVGYFFSFNTETSGGVREHIQEAFLQRYFPVTLPARVKADPSFTSRASEIAGEYRNTRHSYTTFLRLGSIMGSSTVKVNSDQTISITRGDSTRRYVEVEPYRFREEDGMNEVLFQANEQGQVVHLFGKNSPPSSSVKVQWYESSMVVLGLGIGCLVLLLTGLVHWPVVGWMLRGTTHPTVRRSTMSGFLSVLGWLLCLVSVAFFVSLTLMLLEPDDIVFGNTGTIMKLLLVPQVIAGLAGLVLLGTLIAWFAGYWKFTGRLHYTLVSLAGLGFVWLLWQWNLLSWGMRVN